MTLREHLEAILLVQRPGAGRVPEWNEAANAVSEHVAAALELLNNATKVRLSIEGQVHLPCRAIYDPDAEESELALIEHILGDRRGDS